MQIDSHGTHPYNSLIQSLVYAQNWSNILIKMTQLNWKLKAGVAGSLLFIGLSVLYSAKKVDSQSFSSQPLYFLNMLRICVVKSTWSEVAMCKTRQQWDRVCDLHVGLCQYSNTYSVSYGTVLSCQGHLKKIILFYFQCFFTIWLDVLLTWLFRAIGYHVLRSKCQLSFRTCLYFELKKKQNSGVCLRSTVTEKLWKQH